MNFIETIYCSQYYEMKKSGRDPQKGRLNGTLLSAVVIMLGLVGIVLAANKFIGSHLLNSLPSLGFSGKFIGRIVAVVLLIAIGGTLRFTIGSQVNYNKKMLEWEQLPVEVLEQTVKSSLKIFGITFGVFLLVMVIGFL